MKRARRTLAVALLLSLSVAAPALAYHSADYASADWSISLSELLRAIQFYNVGQYCCDPQGEDGYAPGSGDHTCAVHDADYSSRDWSISLSELLRLIQFYNVGMYHVDLAGEDGYAPGPPDTEAPTAVLDAPPTATHGSDFTLSGTRSSDAGGGTVVAYRWTAVDVSGGGLTQGVPVETATPTLTVTAGTDPVPLGVWTYRLVVVDGSGNESLPAEKVVAVELFTCLGRYLTVTGDTDAPDALIGDEVCDDGAGNCTLRAAVQEANACPGPDVIDVGEGTHVLTLGQLVLTDEVTVRGAGASSTVVDGNAASRVFSVSATAFAVTFEDLTIRNGNVAGSGAGVATSAPLTTFRNTVITRNTATGDSYGGGVVAWGATTVFENSEISHNKAHHAAIAFGNNTLVLRNSTVSYNRGDNWPYYVGGIIDYSTAPASLAIENSTIAGNEGRALLLHGAQATITNSTISGNQREGIRVEPNSSVTVTNSILHGNGPNCSVNGGTLASGGHNIDGANTCGFAAGGDLVNTTPMLGPLADNGGPTPTMGLLTGSPALDAGDSAVCPEADQRGVLRDDGACDIGAVEGAFPFATCLGANVAVDSAADVVDADIGDGVCDDGVGNCTLRAAVQETNACLGPDVIDLPAGTYLLAIAGTNENASATGDLDVTDDLTIHGAGMVATVIDGNGAVLNDRVFQVLNGVTTAFDGLTIQNGNTSSNGGGIDTTGDLTLTNASVSGNTASGHGGGVCNWGAGATVTIADSALSNNMSGGSGGALLVAGEVNVSGSTLAGNNFPSRMAITGPPCTAIGGSTDQDRGNSLLEDNSGLDANTAGWPRWWAWTTSTVIIADSAISNSGTATDPPRSTGGVRVYTDSTLAVTRSTITGNRGGGLSCSGNPACAGLTVTDSAIEGNSGTAVGSYGFDGPGIFTTGPTTVAGSSISNNYVNATLGGTGAGGGIYASSDLTVVNSTISGNSIPNNAVGGAIYFTGTTGSIINATVADNYALYGPGVRVQNDAGVLTIANSILLGSWTGYAGTCTIGVGVIVSGGHNIDSANTCGFAAEGDLIDTDPLLGALADNGGPTWTRALQAVSPAIDAGDDAVCGAAPVDGVDQRGVSRPQGVHCDIGAYEYP